jgi:hypothetical protein
VAIESHWSPESGTFRVTQDLPAVRPDKRKTRDWRAMPIKKGELLAVRYCDVYKRWHIFPDGGYEHEAVLLKDVPDLVRALEPVEDTPSLWLKREHGRIHAAPGILDVLVAEGTLTMAQVKEAYEKA